MKVALAQMHVIEGRPDRNLAVAAQMAAEAARAGAAVVAFPELFPSGYDWRVILQTTESDTREHRKALRALARGITVVAGSFAERRGKNLHNTTLVVRSGGRVAAEYRKSHLFGLLGEDRAFKAGGEIVSCRIDGWRAGISTCYDLRFPELFRNMTFRHRADLIFVQAAWPMPRQSPWDLLLRARAIENQCYVCGTNRVGPAGKLEYFGSSQIIDPLGEVLANKGREEGLVYAEIDRSEVRRVRKLIPALKDRRPLLYGKY